MVVVVRMVMVVRSVCQKKERREKGVEFESQKRRKKMARCLGRNGRNQEDGRSKAGPEGRAWNKAGGG